MTGKPGDLRNCLRTNTLSHEHNLVRNQYQNMLMNFIPSGIDSSLPLGLKLQAELHFIFKDRSPCMNYLICDLSFSMFCSFIKG